MKSAALLLFVVPLTACFDFNRLFPERDLGARDQSAVADLTQVDLSSFDGEDSGPSAACTAHLHDGVWSSGEYGPGGMGSSAVSNVWADPNGALLMVPWANSFFSSSDEGKHWVAALVPPTPQWGPTIWGSDPQHFYFAYAPDSTNTHLFEIDLSNPSADLSANGALARDVTSSLSAGGMSLLTGRAGTKLVLLGGLGDSTTSAPAATVLYDGTNATPAPTPGGFTVAGLAVTANKFFRSGYRFLQTSSDGINWTTDLYMPSNSNDLYLAIGALVTGPVDAAFPQIWAGQLPSGEEIYVTAVNTGATPAQVLCWQKGADGPRCQVMPFTPSGIWGTSCGVILVVGPMFQAMRYDAASDQFERETQTPLVQTLSDDFVGVTGRADGTAIAYTNIGYVYLRN